MSEASGHALKHKTQAFAKYANEDLEPTTSERSKKRRNASTEGGEAKNVLMAAPPAPVVAMAFSVDTKAEAKAMRKVSAKVDTVPPPPPPQPNLRISPQPPQ